MEDALVIYHPPSHRNLRLPPPARGELQLQCTVPEAISLLSHGSSGYVRNLSYCSRAATIAVSVLGGRSSFMLRAVVVYLLPVHRASGPRGC